MAGINRVGSPMDVCHEGFDETSGKIEQKRKLLEKKQKKRSPFLVGSIEEVNRKISKLDRKLQQYTQLVCESRASDYKPGRDVDSPSGDRGEQRYERKEKETREVNRFAGVYAIRQTLMPGRSERVKNISKISLQPSKTNLVKKESGKPKFVELHQYPGYDPHELTPLPDEIAAYDILQKAADAHIQLRKKLNYKPVFEQWFYSPMSQAVFQDMFWYLFLEKFQSIKNSQVKLFDRVSNNFVKLMIFAKNPIYRDVFFKEYPTLISQAIYAAFCFSFPDSYRQFGEPFKEYLSELVFSWMGGIKPAPRCWMSWNFDKLEPPNIKMREEIMNAQKSNKKSTTSFNFDFLENLFPKAGSESQYASSNSLNQSWSRSSIHGTKPARGMMRRKSSQNLIKSMSKSQTYSMDDDKSSDAGSIKKLSSKHVLVMSSEESDTSIGASVKSEAPIISVSDIGGPPVLKSAMKDSKQKAVETRGVVDALTPIRETTLENEVTTDGRVSSYSIQPSKVRIFDNQMESHPACRGPDFVKSVFDLYGHSPLVAHFMPFDIVYLDIATLDSKTYREVMTQSYKKVREIEHQYQEFYDKNIKDNAQYMKKQRELLQAQLKREAALLSKPKEVKRLSDLLILEQRKDQDSLSAGAHAAVEAALMAVEL
ncbi:hypothetical protein ScPMuIL_004730 [Solemya velum]